MARQLVDSMCGPWVPSDYRDAYTDRVNSLIDAKKNEKEFQSAAEPSAATNVADLTQALRASEDAAKKSPRTRPASGSKPGKAAAPPRPARKRARRRAGRRLR